MTAPTNVQACYRHPDRVAGIVCQRCDRPICPSCMNQASVGFHCPECTSRGAQKVHQGVGAARQRPLVMQVLIAVNLLAFLAQVGAASGGGLMGSATGRVFQEGALWAPLVPEEPWRLVTAGFLHSGLFHIGFNMYALYVLGTFLEPALGRARFAALYGSSLLAGSLGVVLLDVVLGTPFRELPVTVGASGAIYGLFGAAIVSARRNRMDLMRSGLLPIIGINLVFTFAIPGISIGGHLGGLAGGLIAGLVLIELPARIKAGGPAIAAGIVAGLGVVWAVVAYVLTLRY